MPYAVAGLLLLVIILMLLGGRLQRRLSAMSKTVDGLRDELRRRPIEPPASSVRDQGSEEVSPVVITALGRDPEPLPVGRVAVVSLGVPLIKIAAFSYALRHAFSEETRIRASIMMRRELRRQRRLHRKAHRASTAGGHRAEQQRGWIT
jgi:hypothetical protein